MRLLRNINDWVVFSEYSGSGSGSGSFGPERYPCFAMVLVGDEEIFSSGEEVVFIYPDDVAFLMEGMLGSSDDFSMMDEMEELFPLIKEALSSPDQFISIKD